MSVLKEISVWGFVTVRGCTTSSNKEIARPREPQVRGDNLRLKVNPLVRTGNGNGQGMKEESGQGGEFCDQKWR